MAEVEGEGGVIKSFLVSLGYKEDPESRKKFVDGISTVTKAVFTLDKTIVAAATAIVYGVYKFTSNLEQLYFAAIRTRSTATEIKAVQLAFQNLGASADDALGSLESIASFQRRNPAGAGFLASLGVTAKDGKDQLVQLAHAFQNMPEYLAFQYGDLLGLSEKSVLAMLNKDFDGTMKRAAETMKDAKFDEAAKDAHDTASAMRDMAVQGERIANTLLDEHFQGFIRGLEKIVGWLSIAFDWLVKADGATNGWATTIALVLVGLRALGVTGLLSGLGSIAAGITSIGLAVAPVLGALTALAVALYAISNPQKAFDIMSKVGGKGFTDWIVEHVGGGIARLRASMGFKEDKENVEREESASPNANSVKRANYIVNQLENKYGWTHEQAVGIAAALHGESYNFDEHAIGDSGHAYGIAQWHEDRQKKFEKLIGKKIQWSSLDDQIKFIDYEMTQDPQESRGGSYVFNADTAEQAAYNATKYWLRPRDLEGQARSRSSFATTLNHILNANTTINAKDGRQPAGTVDRSPAAIDAIQPSMVEAAQPAAPATNLPLVSPNIQQTIHAPITIQGASDPNATAQAVKKKLESTMSEAMRSLSYYNGG